MQYLVYFKNIETLNSSKLDDPRSFTLVLLICMVLFDIFHIHYEYKGSSYKNFVV